MRTFFAVTDALWLFPFSTISLATLRQRVAISLSRLRTPLSFVYLLTTCRSASELILNFPSPRPWLSVCLPTRNFFDISSFSCSV